MDAVLSTEVRIRVQTNNMPNKCYEYNSADPNVPDYVAVDFTVAFNTKMKDIVNYTADDIATQESIDFLLCDVNRTNKSNMPI